MFAHANRVCIIITCMNLICSFVLKPRRHVGGMCLETEAKMAESSIVESCAPLPAGGYECDFVDDISEALLCPVCLLPFRDPHILDCCGAKYCAPCIGRVKTAGQPCPLCKQEFSSLLDRNDQRKVLSLGQNFKQ